MKLLLILTTTLSINLAIADKTICPTAGAYVEREVLKAAGVNKDHANVKWMSKCMNGYVQGICESKNGELKQVLNPAVINEATSYCVAELKRIIDEQRKAGLIK